MTPRLTARTDSAPVTGVFDGHVHVFDAAANPAAAGQTYPDFDGSADRLLGLMDTFGVAAALQFSIAAAQILLTVAVACWLAVSLVYGSIWPDDGWSSRPVAPANRWTRCVF